MDRRAEYRRDIDHLLDSKASEYETEARLE
jgi:hypothetical protein